MAYEEDTTNNYRIKDILFLGSSRRVLLQSANGPCPLLAICNVLLLRNQIAISSDRRYISFTELVDLLSGWLFDANSAASSGEGGADMQANLESCLSILPRLNVGLDVNCRFSGPTDFEYTEELAVFDMVDISLFHGWVVSRQDERAAKAFAHLTYNQVVEKLIAMQEAQQQLERHQGAHASGEAPQGDSTPEELQHIVEEGLLIQDFLDRTASQLSYDGLLALHETVPERRLGVFFRNSHFSTLMKFEGDLYLLCTDIAFAHSHVVWEKLDEVDGNTSYCDAYFKENSSASDEAAALAAAQAAQDQLLAGGAASPGMDADALLAMQLMQEDAQAAEAARRQQQQQQVHQQQQQMLQQQQQVQQQLQQHQPPSRHEQRQPLRQQAASRRNGDKNKCCVVQ